MQASISRSPSQEDGANFLEKAAHSEGRGEVHQGERHEIRVSPKEQTVCRGPEEGHICEEMGPELVGPSGGLLSRTVRKPMWKAWLESRAVGVVCGAARCSSGQDGHGS